MMGGDVPQGSLERGGAGLNQGKERSDRHALDILYASLHKGDIQAVLAREQRKQHTGIAARQMKPP